MMSETDLEPEADGGEPAKRSPELQSPAFNRFGLPLAKFVAGTILFVFGPTRYLGRYRVPKTGGLLILANHISDLDPPIVQVGCPRTIYFMAKSELFEMGALGKALGWFKAFPVRRGEPDRSAIRTAVDYLKAGQAVCVFPEGELSESGDLLSLKAGVALIARMADVPVICAGIKGSNRMMPYGKLLPRPAWGGVSLTWGEPRRFERGTPADTVLSWVEGQLKELTGEEGR